MASSALTEPKFGDSPSSKPAPLRGAPDLVWASLAILLVLLAVLSWVNRFQLNADAIGYLRIAEYIAEGRDGLRVSGYWSPLLSWLMVPALAAGMEPLVAARVCMAVTGLVFWAGCLRVLSAFNLPRSAVGAGSCVCAVGGGVWTAERVTPDILVAAFICLACAEMLDSRWLARGRISVRAGVWWGLAFYAKAVAFPLALLIGTALAVLWLVSEPKSARNVRTAALITYTTFGLLAAPWILTLSAKYGRLTYSTVPRIAHALVGPDSRGQHPAFNTINVPEEGRCANWEDPSGDPYRYWSPLTSWRNFTFQTKLIVRNLLRVNRSWRRLDPLGLGILAGLCTVYIVWTYFGEIRKEMWLRALVPIAAVFGLTLPVYAGELRYYFSVYPFVWVLCFSVMRKVALLPWRRSLFSDRTWAVVLLVYFSLPLAGRALTVIRWPSRDAYWAKQISERLEATGKKGSVAGPHGLWVAYCLRTAWYGQAEKASNRVSDEYVESGARIVVLQRDDQLVNQFAMHPRITEVDLGLQARNQEGEVFPFRVFEVAEDRSSAKPARSLEPGGP